MSADTTRSPFYVIEHAISPARCEQLCKELSIIKPTLDASGRPLKHERLVVDEEHVLRLQQLLREHAPAIEERYTAKVKGMEKPVFQQFFEDAAHPCQEHGCENSKYVRRKWVKVRDIDLVGYLWLKDFNSGVPLDPRFEVYGGKLEFPAYNFSLVPQRGTLVLFPAGPHFITAISPVFAGSLEQIKITVKLTTPNDTMWLYQPANFPGTYQQWFIGE
jgi:hypothetical protein